MGNLTTSDRAAPIPDESGPKNGEGGSRLVEDPIHNPAETLTMSRSSAPC